MFNKISNTLYPTYKTNVTRKAALNIEVILSAYVHQVHLFIRNNKGQRLREALSV